MLPKLYLGKKSQLYIGLVYFTDFIPQCKIIEIEFIEAKIRMHFLFFIHAYFITNLTSKNFEGK